MVRGYGCFVSDVLWVLDLGSGEVLMLVPEWVWRARGALVSLAMGLVFGWPIVMYVLLVHVKV